LRSFKENGLTATSFSGQTMKIRHPFLIKTAGFTISLVVRSLIRTVRYRYIPEEKNYDPNQKNFQGRYIYAFWHENILIPAYHYGRPDIKVLISQHADGEMIAQACNHLGFGLVRGSSTRGGVEAVRNMLKLSQTGHLAITPDGPRGPRRTVQPGVAYLAAKTGLPIIPMGVAFGKAKRMNSWDKFAIPSPFSEVVLVTTKPIFIPDENGKMFLEEQTRLVQSEMDRATELAEQHLLGKLSKAA